MSISCILELRDWENTRSIILSKRFIIFHPNPYASTKLCLTDKAYGTPLIEPCFKRLNFTSWAHMDVHRFKLFRSFDLGNIFLWKPTDFVPLLICKNSIYSKTEDQLPVLHDARRSKTNLVSLRIHSLSIQTSQLEPHPSTGQWT